jgi:Spy/CpxP family protein refolding chaperone
MKKLLLLSMCVILSVVLYAQCCGGGACGGESSYIPGLYTLDLSKAQLTKIQSIETDFSKNMLVLVNQLRQLQFDQRTAISKKNNDAEVKKIATNIDEISAELEQLSVDYKIAVEKELTAKQVEELKKIDPSVFDCH